MTRKPMSRKVFGMHVAILTALNFIGWSVLIADPIQITHFISTWVYYLLLPPINNCAIYAIVLFLIVPEKTWKETSMRAIAFYLISLFFSYLVLLLILRTGWPATL
jgi:hypothetical protein